MSDGPSELDLLRIAVRQARGSFTFFEVELDAASFGAFAEIVFRDWNFDDQMPLLSVALPNDNGVAAVESLCRADGPMLSGLVIGAGDRLLQSIERDDVLRTLNFQRDQLASRIKGPLLMVVSPGRLGELASAAPDLHSVRADQFCLQRVAVQQAADTLPVRSAVEQDDMFDRRMSSEFDAERSGAMLQSVVRIADATNALLDMPRSATGPHLATLAARLRSLQERGRPGDESLPYRLLVLETRLLVLQGRPVTDRVDSIERAVRYFEEREIFIDAAAAADTLQMIVRPYDEQAAMKIVREQVIPLAERARVQWLWFSSWQSWLRWTARTRGAVAAQREGLELASRAESMRWSAGRMLSFWLAVEAAKLGKRRELAAELALQHWLPAARACDEGQSLATVLHETARLCADVGTAAMLLQAEQLLIELFAMIEAHPELGAAPPTIITLYERVRRQIGRPATTAPTARVA
jgi:hypothetical protein